MDALQTRRSYHPSRRKFIHALILASGAPSLMLATLRHASAMSEVPIIEGVQALSGDVDINGQPASVGQLIKPGDVVRTGGNDSHVTIIIGQHAYLLRENSEIEFSLSDITDAQGSVVSGQIDLLNGAMLAVFAQTNTLITTPLASIGIRGTACYIDSAPTRTYACVCYGTGELRTAHDGTHLETVNTTHHDQPRFIYPPGAPRAIESAPVIDHSDVELRMLEALVGRRPPFDTASPGSGFKQEY